MQEASSLIRMGWKVRRNPAGKVFFSTFPFIELLETWEFSTALSAQFRNLIDAFRKSMGTH
jgi:hypothetical protein